MQALEREEQDKANRGIRLVQAEPASDYNTRSRTLKREQEQISSFKIPQQTQHYTALRSLHPQESLKPEPVCNLNLPGYQIMLNSQPLNFVPEVKSK